MKLNHVDLPVPDIAATRRFFETQFDFRCIFAREDGLTVLLDEDAFALTLSPLPHDDADLPAPALSYPTGFHVGFNVDDQRELFEILERLVSAGVPIVRPLGDLGGALTFHCEAPGRILVEVAWRAPETA